MRVIAVIVVLVVVGVRAGILAARGGRSTVRTAALTLSCAVVALGCLVGSALLVPCALFQNDLEAAITGSSSPFCPSFLSSSGER